MKHFIHLLRIPKSRPRRRSGSHMCCEKPRKSGPGLAFMRAFGALRAGVICFEDVACPAVEFSQLNYSVKEIRASGSTTASRLNVFRDKAGRPRA